MRKFWIPAFLVLLSACVVNQYADTNRDYKRQAKALSKEIRKWPLNGDKSTLAGTTNFGLRRPDFVIIHHTAQNSCAQTLKTFTTPASQVSAHYVVCKDGAVHHMLNDYLRAWQAGRSSWGNNKDINSCSIGIELDNNGEEPFTAPQINSLLKLLDTLKQRYGIPAANFIGHADIAPTRKKDPNVYFPWEELARHGFGLWYRDTSLVAVPENFNAMQALRIIGYSVKDTTASIMAFKRHFEMQDSSTVFLNGDKKILYDLMLQYR